MVAALIRTSFKNVSLDQAILNILAENKGVPLFRIEGQEGPIFDVLEWVDT